MTQVYVSVLHICHKHASFQIEVDVIEDIEEYQTIPGIIILVLRVIVMLVFLAALRDTMAHEYTPERINFFLHFGAASLVWFIYLPVCPAEIAYQFSFDYVDLLAVML